MLTQKDVDLLETSFKEVFATKEELKETKGEIVSLLDRMMGELKTIREGITMLTHRSSTHEDRLTKLEEKQSYSPQAV